MDLDYKNEPFLGINFKRSVTLRFKAFSKKLGVSHTVALALMLDFFETNKLSPKESIGPSVHTLENLIKKRVGCVIAILRDMEKKQTRPTVAMMQALFEEAEPKSEPPLTEKRSGSWFFEKDNSKTSLLDFTKKFCLTTHDKTTTSHLRDNFV